MLIVYFQVLCGLKILFTVESKQDMFSQEMNIELVKNFSNGTFNRGSAILKIKYYNTKNLIVQYFLVKEREEKLKLILCEMVVSSILQLISVDIQENFKKGCKIIGR